MTEFPNRCPYCVNCPNRWDVAHEPWWLAMCGRWQQCPDDPDAFWNMDRDRYRIEEREAKLDPQGYYRGRSGEDAGPYTHIIKRARDIG